MDVKEMKFGELPYRRIELDPLPAELLALGDAVKAAKDAAELEAAYRALDRYMGTVMTMATLADVRFTIDTRDEYYKGERSYYDEKLPAVSEYVTGVRRALLASPLAEDFRALIGDVPFGNLALAARTISEKIVPDMIEENRLASEYQALTAAAQIPFRGETCTLQQLSPYKQSTDRAVREAAYRAEDAYFASVGEQIDRIYGDMVRVRTRMAHAMGFKNYTEMGYCIRCRNCYGPAEVEKYRDMVVESVVPLVGALGKKAATRCGIPAGETRVWDHELIFPEGNPAPTDTPEVLFANGLKMYRELSPETGAFMDGMLRREMFDYLSKPGKAAGGYCTELRDFGTPFVFANFCGAKDDIEVLTHECGHAFAAYEQAKRFDLMDKADYPSDVAEIHSMSMEFFTYPWMPLFFGENAPKYYYSHLLGTLAFLPYGCAIDHFQQSAYDHPEWTPEQRHAEWLRLEKRYQPELDFADLPYYGKGGMWQFKLHIFLYPFYYIDYCFAQYAALRFYMMMNEDREKAWKAYYDLIAQGGTKTYLQLLEGAGIPSPFSPGALAEVADYCRRKLEEEEKAL